MISVIIPNLDSPIIDQVIHALRVQTARQYVDEILVVGPEWTGSRSHLDDVRMITTSQPLSAASARNLGAQEARSDHLLFLDADCISVPDLVAWHLACHRAGFSVVGGSVALESANYWVQADNALVFAPVLTVRERGHRTYVPSLNFSIGRALFLSLGGFDERFHGAGGEDMDLCLRLRHAGHTAFFEPHAMVFHRPTRNSADAVWRHLYSFGQVHSTIWALHATTPAWLVRHPWIWSRLIRMAAPLLAVADVGLLYQRVPGLRREWLLSPGMMWGKLAWYWGLTAALCQTRPMQTARTRPSVSPRRESP